MTLPIVHLRDVLRRELSRGGISRDSFATQIGMSVAAVNNFLSGRTTRPHEQTVDLIEMWLKDREADFSIPSFEAKPSAADIEALEDMGIKQPENTEEVPVTQLNRLEKSVVIQGIMNSRCIETDQKLRIISHLFPSL